VKQIYENEIVDIELMANFWSTSKKYFCVIFFVVSIYLADF
jgi:hypothetical protein